MKVKALVAQSCVTLQLHWLQPTRFLCPWYSPGKNTGVGSRSILQGIFPTQGSTPVSYNAGGFFTIWATREAQFILVLPKMKYIGINATKYV